MKNNAFVIIESVDDGRTILAAHIRATEDKAVDFGVEIVKNSSDDTNLCEVRKNLTEDWFWSDGSGWVVSITKATSVE